MKKPEFIKHFSEIQEPDNAHYPNSEELLSIGSPFGKAFGLKRLGIHHELLPPGRRTSYPHAEADEEEFIYVIEGHPDVWIDGELFPLQPGDGVGFPSGTGISHTFINNSESIVRLLVVGEKIAGCRVYYPKNPERELEIGEKWWGDAPQKVLGPHDGKTTSFKKKINKKDFIQGNDPIDMSPGEMLATLRQLQELTQMDLAKKTGMTQANISNMESGRQQIGRDRALVLAKALKVHPAVIMFPNYQVEENAA